MDALTLKVNLDCLRKDSQAIINAKVGEANGRKVVFTLYEGRTAFFCSGRSISYIQGAKPDGTILYNNCVIDDGKVEYTITSQTVAVAGVYACELQIVSDGRIIYSPYVTLNVMDNLYADTEVESSNEFTELENALNKIPSLEVIYSKYTKPDGGIPKADLANDVQASLNKADTALQEHQSLAAYRTAEAQDLIDNSKQDKLTAGENITIADDGKTISAKGVGVLEVTLTTQNGVSVADKTFEQVKAAVDSGIPVLKVHSDGALLWFFLLDKSPTEIDFVGLYDEQIIAYLTAKQDGTWETTVAARVTAEMLSSLNDKIGNLSDLNTEAKNNLVAAINEAAQSGGGGGSTSIAMRVEGGYIQYSTDNGKTWVNLIAEADLKGDKGDKGADGADGKSAYKYAQEGGYTGTETEFAEKLASGAMFVLVTDNNGTLSADKTYIDIYNAILAGIPVLVDYNGVTLPFIEIDDALYFGTFYCDDGVVDLMVSTTMIEILPNGEVNDISSYVEALPNPYALTFTGAVTGSYDGSAPMAINIPSAVTDDHINSLIDTKLGVIENGSY